MLPIYLLVCVHNFSFIIIIIIIISFYYFINVLCYFFFLGSTARFKPRPP
jgi:hypothetical protein